MEGKFPASGCPVEKYKPNSGRVEEVREDTPHPQAETGHALGVSTDAHSCPTACAACVHARLVCMCLMVTSFCSCQHWTQARNLSVGAAGRSRKSTVDDWPPKFFKPQGQICSRSGWEKGRGLPLPDAASWLAAQQMCGGAVSPGLGAGHQSSFPLLTAMLPSASRGRRKLSWGRREGDWLVRGA